MMQPLPYADIRFCTMEEVDTLKSIFSHNHGDALQSNDEIGYILEVCKA